VVGTAAGRGHLTAQEIADLLERQRGAYALISTVTLASLNRPFLDQLLAQLGLQPLSDVTINFGKRDGTNYLYRDFDRAVETFTNNNQFNLEILGGYLLTLISMAGDQLRRNDYFDKTPELEFMRHLRNALSHGNKFHFLGGEPHRPASFQGYSLDASMHGQPVFFDYILPGDVLELMEHIERHLRQLP
jgi:hypothetical protein